MPLRGKEAGMLEEEGIKKSDVVKGEEGGGGGRQVKIHGRREAGR